MDTNRLNNVETSSVLPFWSSLGYRQALIIDAFKCLHQGFLEITNWRLARPFFGESLRLLTDYITKRLPRLGKVYG